MIFLPIAMKIVQSTKYVHLCVILIVIEGCSGNQQSSSCDWQKSGLIHAANSREVETVQLSCESGSVEWMYPTTALQIQFQLPRSTADFTACFLPDLGYNGASLYFQDMHPKMDNTFAQSNGLNLIYGDPDVKELGTNKMASGINEIACVNSTGGRLTMLLIATMPRPDISRKIASFKYELIARYSYNDRPEHKRHRSKIFKEKRMLFSGTQKDCERCTNEQLLDTYCSADFVAVGHVLSVADDSDYKWTNIEFLADHVVKETPSDWPVFHSLSVISGFNLSRVPQSDGGRMHLTQKQLKQLQRGFFHVPAQCGYHMPLISSNHVVEPRLIYDRRGFVLMGNYNFGGVWIECIPTYSEMVKLVEDHRSSKLSNRKNNGIDLCDFAALSRTNPNRPI